MRTLSILLAVCLWFGDAWAQSYQDESQSTGQGQWRQYAPDHYNSGQCCYCFPASEVRQGRAGYSEYLALGHWWEMPDSDIVPAIPGKPPEWVTICDPIQRDYPCVIFGAGM